MTDTCLDSPISIGFLVALTDILAHNDGYPLLGAFFNSTLSRVVILKFEVDGDSPIWLHVYYWTCVRGQHRILLKVCVCVLIPGSESRVFASELPFIYGALAY